jgi:hypothetical protein
MFMAFLLASSWLPAKGKGIGRVRDGSEAKRSEAMDGWGGSAERSRVATLARLVLLGVPLACHLGLLRVAAAHGCWWWWQVALLRLRRRGSKGWVVGFGFDYSGVRARGKEDAEEGKKKRRKGRRGRRRV